VTAVRAKRFEFAAALDADGTVRGLDGRHPSHAPDGLLPEHLLLGAVARCTLASLRYYARPASVGGTARMACTITRREEDGLYAVVEATVDFDVHVDPAPAAEALPRLLARAEYGCFIGNSLRARPTYRWRVNGAEAAPAP
jgi:organic hydroperoxide reductase OsmC/OhrA